jgi:hypothetical protein
LIGGEIVVAIWCLAKIAIGVALANGEVREIEIGGGRLGIWLIEREIVSTGRLVKIAKKYDIGQ